MSETVAANPLDRLHWLVKDKPTAGQFEDLGGAFYPQFHFMALLPASALPESEAEKVWHYFDSMFATLVPVRDLIAAYSLRGVMSQAPTSDFSLEVQFSDPYIVDMVRRSLPRELSGCAVASQRRSETTPTSEAEASMFFRDKNKQETVAPATSEPAPAPVAAPAPAAAPEAESAPAETALRVVAITAPPPQAVLPQPVYTAPVAGSVVTPTPLRGSARKKMLVAEGITIQGGEILGCEHLAIEGEAYATIDRCAKLEILEGGIFKGSASVADAEISGFCKGTLVVKGTLCIKGTGHVVGSVQYGSLQVEAGGRIEGEMKMPLNGNGSTATEPQTTSDNPRWVELAAKVSA
jgi:cytoskeletal protein CcmA (bactofilin family)